MLVWRRAHCERMTDPHALFVSYDGLLDPLGASQVVPYVEGLVQRGIQTTLITFEKAARWQDRPRREAMQRRLDAHAVPWRPLRYPQRPRLPATLWDIARGAFVVRREATRRSAVIMH